jgi:hypothetical protein
MIIDVGVPLGDAQQVESFRQKMIGLLGHPRISNSIFGFLEMQFAIGESKLTRELSDQIVETFKDLGYPKVIFGKIDTELPYIIVSGKGV